MRPHSFSTTTTSSTRTASLNASCTPANRLPSVLCAASAAITLIMPAEASTLAPSARTAGKVISMTPMATTTIAATVTRRSITTWVLTRRALRLSGTSVRQLGQRDVLEHQRQRGDQPGRGRDDAEHQQVQHGVPAGEVADAAAQRLLDGVDHDSGPERLVCRPGQVGQQRVSAGRAG